MPNSMFDVYGQLAAAELSPTEQAGRYAMQQDAERLIISDVLNKLSLQPSSRLLEIGCGPGNLLIPLSFHVARAIGIDHEEIIRRYSSRFQDAAVTWLAGEFPNVAFQEKFDRVLIYSVIHCLKCHASVVAFIDAASSLLAPRGRLLVGDIPNQDKKQRFQSSEFGAAFERQWRLQNLEKKPTGEKSLSELSGDVESVGTFSDQQILGFVQRYRERGFDTSVMSQPDNLPFGHTREDLLIVRP